MEAATGVANGRVASLPMSSSSAAHPVRKEWRAISDHPSRSSSSNEDLDRMKLGQTDERTIYEVQQGTDVDYCSITVDGGLDSDPMQQRLHDVSTQRQRLQQMEIELRAQIISRSEIMEMQNSCNDQINEQVNAAAKLKEHLQEREQAIRELELKMEEKDRELRAIKIDHEAAWAKEDLIREQNKELLAYRRERDNYEAERGQQMQQIHELKEHIQEKERQYLELEEQQRVMQETMIFKDEQLREAQAWVTRLDVMQSTTHHSLQTELRERTEQFNHFWHGCQKQFMDMERHHLQAIQQLQLELAEARQRSGTYTDEASMERANSEDASSFGKTNGPKFNVNEDGARTDNPGVHSNGSLDDYQNFATISNAPVKSEHVSGVPIPSSVVGLSTYIPPTQVTALHPFYIPQQGLQHSVAPINSHVPESHMAHFLPMPTISTHQDWHNHQVVPDGSHSSNHTVANIIPTQEETSQVSREEEIEVIKTNIKDTTKVIDEVVQSSSEKPTDCSNGTVVVGVMEPVKSVVEPRLLLDERALLACIVRAIPAGSGGRIRISSTLPNRLGKMLAPLHWHDYKKKYGKLDDFVCSHPELFVIEGDMIEVREGAQEMISATAAIAKVAAAAAAAGSVPYSSSVAVTPMAQNQRLKKMVVVGGDKQQQQQQVNGGVYNINNVKILSKPREQQEQNKGSSNGRQSMKQGRRML